MPLHDWTELRGWEGVHDVWLVELLRSVKPQLPPGFRAHLGTSPALSIGADTEKPDIAVRHWEADQGRAEAPVAESPEEPDSEVVTFALDPELAIQITYHGQLAAAIEIISPANKDRPAKRATYLARYFSYLNWRVNLLVVDVHARPAGFSFADALAEELALEQPPLPTPMAVAYRATGSVPDGGSLLEIWRRPLRVGQPLPAMKLFVSNSTWVDVDLEGTYSRAAADNYLT